DGSAGSRTRSVPRGFWPRTARRGGAPPPRAGGSWGDGSAVPRGVGGMGRPPNGEGPPPPPRGGGAVPGSSCCGGGFVGPPGLVPAVRATVGRLLPLPTRIETSVLAERAALEGALAMGLREARSHLFSRERRAR